jgi:hypothetical protein
MLNANWSSWTSTEPQSKINELATSHRSDRGRILLMEGIEILRYP